MNKLINLIKNINNIRYQLNDNDLSIYNLNNDNKIEVIKEIHKYEDSYSEEYIVSFATQHCHFEDDCYQVFEYINDIINDKSLPIEFFLNDKDLFGGELSRDEYDNISVDVLVKHFGCNEDYILNLFYEIHSWSGTYDIERRPVLSLKEFKDA